MKYILKTCTCGLRFIPPSRTSHGHKYLSLDPLQLIKHLRKMWLKNKHSCSFKCFDVSWMVELMSGSSATLINISEMDTRCSHSQRSGFLALAYLSFGASSSNKIGGGKKGGLKLFVWKKTHLMMITIAWLAQKNVTMAQCTLVQSRNCSNCWPSFIYTFLQPTCCTQAHPGTEFFNLLVSTPLWRTSKYK